MHMLSWSWQARGSSFFSSLLSPPVVSQTLSKGIPAGGVSCFPRLQPSDPFHIPLITLLYWRTHLCPHSPPLLVPLWWAWAINFLKAPHKKWGLMWRAVTTMTTSVPVIVPFHWVIAASSSLIWSSSRYPTYKNEQQGCVTDNTDITAPIQRQEEKVKIVRFSTEAPDFPHSPQSILLLFACTGVHSQMLSCSLMASLSKSLVAKMGQTALCVFAFES